MSRYRDTPLRASVTQSTIRVHARETTRGGFLLRLGALAGSILFIIGLAAWLWHIGWPQRETEHLLEAGLHATQKAQFAVKDVVVEGRGQTSKDALFAALGISAGAPILSFDPTAAAARIAKLPWVASAIVERRFPDTVLVRLTERVPLARWQHEGRTVVIDTNGNPLPQAPLDQFANLLLVVGEGAPAETLDLIDTLRDFPAVEAAMKDAVRVGGRRWDIQLQPHVTAKLPETGLPDALKRLSDLITQQKILERNVLNIDLRMPDRIIIEPAAAQAKPQGDMRL